MRRLLFFVLVFCSSLILAQGQKTITGTVTGYDDNLPVIGATVLIKGTTTGTATDANGKFTLSAPEGAIIEVRFVGLKTTEFEVGTASNYDVILNPDLLGVDEIVVVAYGVTKKESYTGAASVVKSDKLISTPTTSVVKALQANATGVHVVNANGASDSEPIIRIRGTGSITASSAPLWVVDGIAGGTVPNLNDIETVTVLKDAAASSLYGSRAANGVILVTTKKGQAGKTVFTYRGKQSYSTRTTNKFEMLNASEYMQKSWEGLYNYASDLGEDLYGEPTNYTSPANYAHRNLVLLAGKNPFNVAQPFDDNGNLVPGAKLMFDESWFDLAHRTGKIAEHNLTAQGGDERTKFYFSGTYYNQKAITVPDEVTRAMGYVSLETQVNKRIKVGTSSIIRYSEGNTVKDITNGSGTGYAAYTYPNNVPLYELDANFQPVIGTDGKPAYNWNNLVSKDYNPIAQTILDPRGNRKTSLSQTLNFNWKILEGLVFDTKGNGKIDYVNTDDFRNPYHGDGKAYQGSSEKNTSDARTIFTSSTLTYDKTITDLHFNILGGYETEKYILKTVNVSARGFDVPFSDELNIASAPFGYGSSTTETSMISYFSRLLVDFKDKYYMQGSYRRDGSSRFGPRVRWGNFWSISGSWRISEEAFLSDIPWLDDLKIRAGYGTNGNQAVPPYAYLPTYSLGYNYDYYVGMVHNRLPNYDLGWEKNVTTNVALEFGIFQRIRGTVEWFDRLSDDLLMDKPLPPSVGFSSILSNIGGLRNRGVEVELHTTNVTSPNFVWLTDFNISTYTNEITALSQEEIISGTKRWVVGNSLYTWYIQEYAGVDSNTGEAMWYKDILDAEGNPTGERETTKDYNEADRYELGQSIPDFYGSLTNTFTFLNNFNFSFQFYWSVGGKIYNSLMQQTMHDGERYGYQLNKEVLNSWQQPGDVTDVPRFVYNNSSRSNFQSSRFLEDASFLRLRNVSLSYELPKKILGKSGITGASVFVNGDNVLVFTKFKGNDPEQGLSGLITTTEVPNVRTLTVGLSLSF
jgi:TonB-linked SusC/RagA family outer membrane protein